MIKKALRKGLLASAALMLASANVSPAMAKAPVTAATPVPARAPNVIFILADDVGVEGFSVYGGANPTPNVARLANEGVTFENAHSTPLCSPSRTRLMTGIENAKNYEAFGYLAPNSRTFAHMFKDAGYATGIVGKWQLGGNGFDGRKGITPKGAGFDESLLWQERAGTQKGSRYWGPTLSLNGLPKINEEGFGPDLMNDFALDFITRNKDRPFFLYYPMVLPHDPFVVTPATMDAKGVQQKFAGMVGYADRLIGTVIQRLADLGLDENTLVVFTADNGTSPVIVNQRGGFAVKGGKGQPTLNGTHVPMIVRWKGKVPAGGRRMGLFDFLDVLPTLAEATGLRPFAGTEGVSQWPVVQGVKVSVRPWIFEHYAPAWVHMPARFVFDEKRKLYGDGRYVALDPITGGEVPLEPANKAERAHRDYLQRVLDSRDDGPLDPTRFPWCAGETSVDPALPPTVAGCGRSVNAVD